jgi:putative transcriptional regulator
MAPFLKRPPRLTQKQADERLALALKQARDHFAGIDNGTKTEIIELDLDEITAIRRKTGLSQDKFAERLGISVGTLRNWEQGRRSPTGPARKLLDLIDRRPEILLEATAAE